MRILAAVVALLLLSLPGRAQPGVGAAPQERWFVVMLQGAKAGYATLSTTVAQDGTITTRSDLRLSMKRGALELKIAQSSEFVETADGRPVRMRSESSLGSAPDIKEYVWRGDQVEVKIGKRAPVMKPAPGGDWLTPAAAERRVAQSLRAGEKELTVRMVEPSQGLEVFSIARTLVAREPVTVMGREVPGIKWRLKMDRPIAIQSDEYTDESGQTVRSLTSLGVIKVEQMLADKDLALAPMSGPELMMSMLVRPEGVIRDPRDQRRASLIVTLEGDRLPDLPTTAAQRFTRLGPDSGRLVIDLDDLVPEALTDAQRQAALGTSRMVDPTDEALAPLLERARLKDGDTPLTTVRRLRDVVSRHIQTKDLSVGFATSGETVRTRVGDCTEHGVLLAALARRAGLPARVASGLVYVTRLGDEREVFGYHLWTQVYLPTKDGGAWVDADATFGPEDPLSDATHIALSISSLGDDEMQNYMVTTAPLIGRMKIKVETQP